MRNTFLLIIALVFISCSEKERNPIRVTKINITEDSIFVAFNQSMEKTEVQLTFIKPDGSKYINMFMENHSFYEGDTASSYTEVKNLWTDRYLKEEDIKADKALRNESFKEIRYLISSDFLHRDTLGYGVCYSSDKK